MSNQSQLALFGGPKAVQSNPGDMFTWPIITEEDEAAALEVLRKGAMSQTNITIEFEKEYAAWQGTEFALAFHNGTAALQAAMWACGVRRGDEVICPSLTYWASALPVYSLGGTVVFADVDPNTLCIDPNDIEKRISERTKAIIVVHYVGHPCDMDPIMEIARKHNIKVIEDVSHAQGALYKGRMVGSIGDVGAASLMAGKSLAIGEGGIITTNDRSIYEHAIAFGHYERFNENWVTSPELLKHGSMPWGGYKYRMHQISSAVGRVQLKHYDARIEEIQKAMNYFWDLLEGVPGLRAHRPPKDSGSTMGGWYAAKGLYVPEELEGLSVTRFCQAVRAEGAPASPGANKPLHLHPIFQETDVYGDGKPTRIAHTSRDVRELDKDLPVTDEISTRIYNIPWFKHYRPEIIEEYANAYRKAAENYKELLKDDPGNPSSVGGWNFYQQTG